MRTFLLCFLMIPVVTLAQTAYTIEELELVTLNEFLYTSYVLDHNTTPLAEIATADFKLIAGIGIIEDKAQAISGVKNLNISSLNIVVNEVLVKNDMGFVLGVLEMKGTIMGRSVPGKIRFSSVFIKEDDQWRLQLRTMTPMRMKKS